MHWGSVGDFGSKMFAGDFAKYSVASGGLGSEVAKYPGASEGAWQQSFRGKFAQYPGASAVFQASPVSNTSANS